LDPGNCPFPCRAHSLCLEPGVPHSLLSSLPSCVPSDSLGHILHDLNIALEHNFRHYRSLGHILNFDSGAVTGLVHFPFFFPHVTVDIITVSGSLVFSAGVWSACSRTLLSSIAGIPLSPGLAGSSMVCSPTGTINPSLWTGLIDTQNLLSPGTLYLTSAD
jgi:hypothetical protein